MIFIRGCNVVSYINITHINNTNINYITNMVIFLFSLLVQLMEAKSFRQSMQRISLTGYLGVLMELSPAMHRA